MKKKLTPLLWLDSLSWKSLLLMALLFGIAPLVPEPHLVEKLRMLFQGSLVRPIDIFDLLLHSFPLMLAALKGFRQYRKKGSR